MGLSCKISLKPIHCTLDFPIEAVELPGFQTPTRPRLLLSCDSAKPVGWLRTEGFGVLFGLMGC